MSPNEKFARVTSAMVTGFSLVVSLAPGLWLGLAAAALLMACFTLVARLERGTNGPNRQHWYYLFPLILTPSICTLLGSAQAWWLGSLIAAAGGVATYYLVRAFPVVTEQQPASALADKP
ncbi:hypothetical protein [Glutamicibacter uratoxydans]|uniref:hypothetical protein n=1 Tax=Glutamicibacter uratoxydans TaxID=43667 RepID=UPI003D6E8A86